MLATDNSGMLNRWSTFKGIVGYVLLVISSTKTVKIDPETGVELKQEIFRGNYWPLRRLRLGADSHPVRNRRPYRKSWLRGG